MAPNSLNLIFAAAAMGVFQISTSGAATLVSYGFGESSTTLKVDPTTHADGVTGGIITAGSGVALQNSGVAMGTSSARALGLTGVNNPSNSMNSTEAFAVGASRFFTFTITPDLGQQISLERLTMNANLGGTNLSPDFSVRVDTGSGYNTVATGSITAQTGSHNAINLAFAEPTPGALTNLTGTVTVQMVFYHTVTPLPGGWSEWVRMDDIAVIGTVAAVPEVGTTMLGAAGLAFMLFRRGRKVG